MLGRLSRLWRHMRQLWPTWTLLPAAPFVLWTLYCFFHGERRWEHLGFLVGVPLLAYSGPRSKKVYRALLPIGLVGLIYDAMRFVKNVGVNEHTVHLCDLRRLELALFGVTVGGQKITLNDFFQTHHWPALDLYCAIPYGLFIFVPLGYATWLYWKDFAAAQRYTWTFLVLNVVAFCTYHLYPAAPPWYEHARGCVVDIASHASEGAPLARVDAMLGIHYFAGLYGRSNDVFGAVPSLHCAYPMLMVFEGWRLHRTPGKTGLLVYLVTTCFAAVYLDHHWFFDVVMGIVYTIVVWPSVRWVLSKTSDEAFGVQTIGQEPSIIGEEGAVAAPRTTIGEEPMRMQRAPIESSSMPRVQADR